MLQLTALPRVVTRERYLSQPVFSLPALPDVLATMKTKYYDGLTFDETALPPACEVYLCITPVPRGLYWFAASVAWFFSLSSSSSSSGANLCADSKYRHWSVAFARSGDNVVVFQASKQGRTGELTAYMSYRNRNSFFADGTQKINLGSRDIPHERIQNLLNEMSDTGGAYDQARNNCRTWALELLRRLRIPLPDSVTAEDD